VSVLLGVHSKSYVDHVRSLSAIQDVALREKAKAKEKMLRETYVNEHSYDTSRRACGAVSALCSQVHSGRLTNGLALSRPPSPNAGVSSGTLGSLFNAAAVGVSQLKALGCKRVMVVSFDAAPALGTAEIFDSDPSVLTVSLHCGAAPLLKSLSLPAKSGSPSDLGSSKGEGHNVNVSFSHRSPTDADLALAMSALVLPLGQEFRPDMLVVSCGFGLASGDYGGGRMTPSGYSYLIHLLMRLTNGRLVAVTEGGSSPQVYVRAKRALRRAQRGPNSRGRVRASSGGRARASSGGRVRN
jgi:histone deacetylase 6